MSVAIFTLQRKKVFVRNVYKVMIFMYYILEKVILGEIKEVPYGDGELTEFSTHGCKK